MGSQARVVDHGSCLRSWTLAEVLDLGSWSSVLFKLCLCLMVPGCHSNLCLCLAVQGRYKNAEAGSAGQLAQLADSHRAELGALNLQVCVLGGGIVIQGVIIQRSQ